MIQVFKLVHGLYKYDLNQLVSPRDISIERQGLRGHEFTLYHTQSKKDVKKFCFASRVVGSWNSLPSHVVNAPSLNTLKNRLDDLWDSPDLKYNYKACV